MKRRPMLRAGFGEQQGAVREIERGEPRAAGNGRAGGLPMQPACDHQVQHDEVVVPEGQDDPLAEATRSEEHTSELQSRLHLVCRLLLEKKKKQLTETQNNERKT